jgi:hypothetical protein
VRSLKFKPRVEGAFCWEDLKFLSVGNIETEGSRPDCGFGSAKMELNCAVEDDKTGGREGGGWVLGIALEACGWDVDANIPLPGC